MSTLLRLALGMTCAFMLTFGQPEAAAQAIGSSMPAADRTLPNATGSSSSLSALAGEKATVVIFWSNQCPWTDKYEGRVMELARTYRDQGVRFVLINSNNASAFPKESLEASREHASGYPMAYLKDEGARLAQAFGAKRTPHVFVFDAQDKLSYAGAVDDSPADPSAVQQPYLKNVLQVLVSGGTPSPAQTPAYGCQLKD